MRSPIRTLLRRLAVWSLLVAGLPAVAGDSVFEDFAGNPASLDAYTGKGKWVLVMYWASDCHVCNVEARNYVDFQRRHADGDIAMLGISMDGRAGKAAAQAFVDSHRINFPNLTGEPAAIARHYQELVGESWYGTPTFLLFDPDGELSAMQVGAIPPPMVEQFIAGNSAKTAETP
jgi:peroxiredoxin